MIKLITVILAVSFTVSVTWGQNFPSKPVQCLMSSKVNIRPIIENEKSNLSTGATIEPFDTALHKTILGFFTQWLAKNKSLPTYNRFSPYNSNAISFDDIEKIFGNINSYKIGEDFVLPISEKNVQIKKNIVFSGKEPVFDLNKKESVDNISSVSFFEIWNIDPKAGVFSKEVKNFGLDVIYNNKETSLFNFTTNSYTKPYYTVLNNSTFNLNSDQVIAENAVYDLRFDYHSTANGKENGLSYDIMNPENTNYYHFLNQSKKEEILTQIINLIKKSDCKIYKLNRGNIDISQTLDKEKILAEFGRVDSVYVENVESYEFGLKIVSTETNLSQIEGIRFYETWFFDSETFSFKKIVNAISLLEYVNGWEHESEEIITKTHLYVRLNNKVKESSGNMLNEKLFVSENNYKIAPNLNKTYADGKYYFIDNLGNPVNKNKYVWTENSFTNGFLKVVKFAEDSQSGNYVMDGFGNIGVFDDYQEIYYDNNYGHYGYIDKTGKEIIPCKFNKVEPLDNGMFLVTLDHKEGLIDKSGKIIAETIYDKINTNCEINGLISVFKGSIDYDSPISGYYGFLDNTGKEVFPLVFDEIIEVGSGILRFKKGDKYGLVDTLGKVLSDFVYDEIGYFEIDFAIAKKQGKYGILNSSGKAVSDFIYNRIGDFENGRAAAEIDLKKGIIDREGKIIIPCQYDKITSLMNGYYLVTINNKSGLANSRGKLLIGCKYDYVGTPYKWLSLFENEGLCGFVDTLGKEIIPAKYMYAFHFKSDSTKVLEGGNYYYIDMTGKKLRPCPFDNIDKQPGNLSIAYVGQKGSNWNGYYFLTDTNGNYISKIAYNGIEDFKNGTAIVQKNDKYGLIDTKGHELLPCSYGEIREYSDDIKILYENKNYWNKTNTGKIFLYKVSNNKLFETKYEHINLLSSGLISYHKNNKIGFINSDLEEFNYGVYDWMPYDGYSELGYGYKLVYKGKIDSIFDKGKFGVIDSMGKEIIPCRYNSIYPIEDSLKILRVFIGKVRAEGVPLKGKFGIIDIRGNQIVPFIYDYLGRFRNHTAIVYNGKVDSWGYPENGKYGLINHNGKILIPLKYDEIYKDEENDHYTAKLGDNYFKYDLDGNLIKEEY